MGLVTPAPPLRCPPLAKEHLTTHPGRAPLGLQCGRASCVGPSSPSLWSDGGGGQGPKPFLTVSCLVGFPSIFPLPRDSQTPCAKETLKEISSSANEETEKQQGYGICPKSHSKSVAEPRWFLRPQASVLVLQALDWWFSAPAASQNHRGRLPSPTGPIN